MGTGEKKKKLKINYTGTYKDARPEYSNNRIKEMVINSYEFLSWGRKFQKVYDCWLNTNWENNVAKNRNLTITTN